MTATNPKTPTASGISRLLSGAGFDRAVIKVGRGSHSGFVVRKAVGTDDAVRVRYYSLSMGTSPERHKEWRARYAKTLTDAGWTVEAGEYELIVTPKAED